MDLFVGKTHIRTRKKREAEKNLSGALQRMKALVIEKSAHEVCFLIIIYI